MAYYSNLDDEEENAQGMNNSEESPSQSSQGSIGSGAGTASSAKAAPVAKPAASGNGPGFNNYYKANQGIAQARLNNAATSNVANQGKQATNAINQATTSFGQRVDAGSLANRENAVQDVTDVTNAARNVTAGTPAVPAPVAPVTEKPQVQAGLATPTSDPVTGKATNEAAPVGSPGTPATALTQQQTDRFGQVINASYKGPESLRQAGLYQGAADKTATAQNTLNNSKTAAGREDLLKNMYQSGGNYTAGLNKLDSALLNANKQGVQSLQDTAKAQGNLGQKLDQAQLGSANLAQNRTAEINKIKEDARNVFSAGKTAEEKATEDRMDAMLVTPVKDANGNPIMKPDGTPLTQWDQLPESFRDIIRNKKTANQQLLDTKLAEYTAANQPDSQNAKQIQNIDGQLTALQNQIRKAVEYEAATSPSNIGAFYQSPEYAAIQEQMSALNTQKAPLAQAQAAYDQGLANVRDSFNMDAVNFNPLEAGILGIQNGEGLYNLGENAIVTGQADRERLISKDEQLRQAVLAQLAGLDQSNRLDTNLKYDNADKAGTQSILDSLDTQGTRTALDAAEKNFEDTAKNTNLTGKGQKKVSRGNMWGKTTRTYKASVDGNVADFLKQAGYDFDAVDESGNPTYSKELLSALTNLDINDETANLARDNAQQQLAASGSGAIAGSAYGPWGALVGSVLGNIAQSGTWDATQHGQTLVEGVSPELGELVQKAREFGGSAATGFGLIGGQVGNALSGAISGIDTGAMKKMGEAEARAAALRDLQRQYMGFLDSQGYANRANVANDEQSNSRVSALTNLINSFDKTNT